MKGGLDVINKYLVVFVAIFSLQMFPELLYILFIHKVH